MISFTTQKIKLIHMWGWPNPQRIWSAQQTNGHLRCGQTHRQTCLMTNPKKPLKPPDLILSACSTSGLASPMNESSPLTLRYQLWLQLLRSLHLYTHLELTPPSHPRVAPATHLLLLVTCEATMFYALTHYYLRKLRSGAVPQVTVSISAALLTSHCWLTTAAFTTVQPALTTSSILFSHSSPEQT